MVEVGDRVLVESERVGSVTRSGVVTAVDGRLIMCAGTPVRSRCLSQVRGPCRSPAMSHRVGSQIAPDLPTGDGRSNGRAPSPHPYEIDG